MTSETDPKPTSSFDELVEAMPRIAEAVKSFPEAVQGQAFDALMASLTGASAIPSTDGAASEITPRKRRWRTPKKTSENGSKTPRRRGSGSPTIVKELDLAPRGKTAFKDFAAEKNPRTAHDRSVVGVYYLVQLAGITPITVDHVFTCYRIAGWKIPKNFTNSLAVTANRKGFFDTSNGQDIKLTTHGINRVEHELPVKAKE